MRTRSVSAASGRALVALGLETSRAAGLALGLVRGPTGAVAEVFPSLRPHEVRLAAAQVESQRALAYVLRRACRAWGNGWLVHEIEVAGGAILDELRRAGRPLVAVSWHSGIAAVVTAGLARCGYGGLVLCKGDWPVHEMPGFSYAAVTEDPQDRARTLVASLAALGRRQAVVVFTDAIPARQAGAFLGRAARVRNGPAGLARLGKAALVPVEGRLERGRLLLEIAPPIPVADDDEVTTGRLADVFEARVAAHPGRVWRSSLERMVLRTRRLP